MSTSEAKGVFVAIAGIFSWLATSLALHDHQLSGLPHGLAIAAQVAMAPAVAIFLIGTMSPSRPARK